MREALKLPTDDELKAAEAFLVWIAERAVALQGVRDGTHKIVPKQPTRDMAQAGEWADINEQGPLVSTRQAAVIYCAMIEAAP